MKKIFFVALPLCALACGDDSTVAADMAAPDLAAGPDMAMPLPPFLGEQIDRMGRPAVNTALTDPFDLVPGMSSDMIKDGYNHEGDRTRWVTQFAPAIKANLALLDGLDGKCGNQAFADTAAPRYTFLANALADDVLLLDASQSTCKLYLGVEAKALGLTTTADCGGRTPTEDVIDETYSLLAAGVTSGVSDGVDKDADNAPSTSFPFLGAPN